MLIVVRAECSGRGRELVAWLVSVCVSASLCIGPCSHAAAQADTRAADISTRVDPCVPVELDQFHRVLAIELGTSIDYSADVHQKGGLTTVSLSCRPDGIQLHLEDGLTRKSMTRVVDITRIEATSRSRLLALAVAEFVVASWVELRLSPPKVLGAPPPQAASRARRVVTRYEQAQPPVFGAERPTTWRLGLSFDTVGFTSARYPVPGAGAQLLHRGFLPLELSVSLQWAYRDVLTSSFDDRTRDIRVTLLSTLLAVRYAGSLGAFDLSIGLGGRLGLVQLAGRTGMQGIRSKAPWERWGGSGLVLGAAYRASPQLRLVLELETGLVLQPVNAVLVMQPPDAPRSRLVLLRIEQAWVGGSLGFAWAF